MSQTKTQLVEGFNINPSAPADALVIDSSGRLGLGTSSPSTLLHLASSDPRITIQDTDGTNQTLTILQGAGATTFRTRNDTANGTFFFQQFDGTTNSTALTIASTGNVGIGTTSPGQVLHVEGNIRADGSLIARNPSATGQIFIQSDDATYSASINVGGTGNGLGYTTGQLYFNSETKEVIFNTKTSAGESVRIDSSGRLLVGTASALDAAMTAIIRGSTGAGNLMLARAGAPSDGQSIGTIYLADNQGNQGAYIDAARDGGTWTGGSSHPTRLIFATTSDGASSPVERMRIDRNGSVQIGASGRPGSFTVDGDVNNNELVSFNNLRTVGGYAEVDFRTAGTERGNIRWETGNVSYNTSSDYRLKENIRALTGGIELVKQLRPCLFNFIEAGPEDTLGGFIAHEVQEVVDYAVSGQKDEVRKDGSIKPQSIDQSKLVPLLTAALQEAIAKIETLEAKVTNLEAS